MEAQPIEMVQLKYGLAFPGTCMEYILPYAALERVDFLLSTTHCLFFTDQIRSFASV